MAREWTEKQLCAMNERDHTLLVCAAAGSGKTAVLTERIIRSLTDPDRPADISRLLVVTFTKAAAGELRQRISKVLSEAISEALLQGRDTTHLSRQLMLLGGASISTIDAFYLELVKQHFQEAGMPPSFRMADENELLSLRRELMNDTVDRMYADFPEFYRISDAFCDIRFENSLTDTLLAIHKRLDRYPEGADILLRSADEMLDSCEAPLESCWGKVFGKEIKALAHSGRILFAKAIDQMEGEAEPLLLQRKLGPVYLEYLDRCRDVEQALELLDYEAVINALAAPFCRRKGGGAMPVTSPHFAELVALCDEFRARWKSEAPPLAVFGSAEILKSAEESAVLLRLLHEALTRFESAYSEAKRIREVAEFSDVSRAAYRLLVDQDGAPTPLATQLSENYDAVYIDEYQDVNAMQDATFRAISKPRNRFMVGDIKQSIYRFRGAQPAIFADYRRRFPALEEAKGKDEATVFMSNCFRCDESIIRFSNTVSGYLFEQNAESIGYTKEDDLVFSKQRPSEEYQSPKCRVVLIERAKKAEEESGEQAPESHENAEAAWIASEIYRLLHSDERKADGTPIRPKDIAVLMRGATLSAPLANELTALGIPCNDTSRSNFFENADVLCVYSLLAALDNPWRDVQLAAALRSPFFGFSLEELVKIRSLSERSLSLYEAMRAALECADEPLLKEHLQDFFGRFLIWREKAQALPVDRLLRYLYRESAILSFAGRKEKQGDNASSRRANLQRLYEYARTFEAGGFKGLYQFIRFVDSIMESGGKMPPPDGPADAVSLITIHSSKGLEYPVCFLASTATPFSKKDLEPMMLDDEYLGCALRIPNAGPFSRADTFFRKAIELSAKRQNLEEEMRILYVAMTRARERLYVTAKPPHGTQGTLQRAELAAACREGAFLTADGPAYIHWILTALLRCEYHDFAAIELCREEDIPTHEALLQSQDTCEKDAKRCELSSLLRERFSFTYPYAHLTRLPAKLSVSRLSPGVLDVYDTEAVAPDALREQSAEQLLHTFERVPLFGTEDTERLAAERGTATHEFLQFCDFERAAAHGIESELERLIEARFLSPRVRDLVRIDELERFFSSKFYTLLREAKVLHRETRFHIFLPASEFTQNPQLSAELREEKLAVQGVIDLFFRDAAGNLILCDYKTDRLTPAQRRDPALAAAMLKQRHGEQLSYYAKALEEICGSWPDRIFLFSLHLGEALEIQVKKT